MKKFIVFIAILSCAGMSSAQAPDPPAGGGPPCGPPFGDPCIPIDGGVSLLIAAGLALGGKKAYDAARNKQA
jgi:hypothetical protein